MKPLRQFTPKDVVRFLSRVEITDGCWEWQGSRHPNGHGQIGIGQKNIYTHRFMWWIVSGEMPDLLVCHKCDNPPCVRPDHLFLGTQKDNMQDAALKFRVRGKPRLTPDIVLTIRREHSGTYAETAKRFGISRKQVSNIVNRRHWKWLDEEAS